MSRLSSSVLTFGALAFWTIAVRPAHGELEPPSTWVQVASFAEDGEEVIKGGSRLGPGSPLATGELIGPIDEPAAILPPEEDEDEDFLGGYFFLNYRGGELLGQRSPYTSVGFFGPRIVYDGVLFMQGQLLLDNRGEVGGSVALGRRWYNGSRDRVLGVDVGYDLRQSWRGNTFQQVSVGLESRGDLWDFLGNVRVPVGDRIRTQGSVAGPVRFQGNDLVRDLLTQQEAALTGVDLEIARRLDGRNLWLAGGWYHFEGGGQRTDGVSVGLRGYLTDRLAAQVAVTDDPLFQTNVAFSVAYCFGGTSSGNVAPQNVYQRLMEPIRRDPHVVIGESTVAAATQMLTSGGAPITVTHVNDAGLGIGTGTANDPYGSLTDAAGAGTDIVYVHADTTFNGQAYALAPGQRLLGESDAMPHQVNTDQLGVINLPRATDGVDAPIIQNSPVNAVTLANNTEVSGFDIRQAGSAGIFADNSVTANVNRTSIQNSFGDGVQVVGSSGNFQFEDVDIAGSAGQGYALGNVNAATIMGGNVTGCLGAAIQAIDVNLLAIDAVNINNSGGPSIQVVATGVNTVNATVTNNIAVANGAPSSFEFGPNAGAVLNLNLFDNEDTFGYQLQRNANGFLRLGGFLGQGGFFNDDNGNVANNANNTGFGPPNVIINGVGNQIEIVDPATIPVP